MKQRAPPAVRLASALDLTCIVLIVALAIPTIVLQGVAPTARPANAFDASIAYAHDAGDMPFWVALVVPALAFVALLLALECGVLRQQGWLAAVAAVLNAVLSLLASLAVVGFLTELFKRLCGRLRPDFLARCRAAALPEADGASVREAFVPAQQLACTNPDAKEVADGQMSFPSGHSSCSMAIGLFAALYLLWCLHWRHGGRLGSSLLAPGRSWRARLGAEAGSLVVTALLLFFIAWPWGVAASRFIDNRHNVSDIVGGLLLAICFTPLLVLRLAQRNVAWAGELGDTLGSQPPQQQQLKQPLQQQLELTGGGDGSRAAANGVLPAVALSSGEQV